MSVTMSVTLQCTCVGAHAERGTCALAIARPYSRPKLDDMIDVLELLLVHPRGVRVPWTVRGAWSPFAPPRLNKAVKYE